MDWSQFFNPKKFSKDELHLIYKNFSIYFRARKTEKRNLVEEVLIKQFVRQNKQLKWEEIFEKYEKLLNFSDQAREDFFKKMLLYIGPPTQVRPLTQQNPINSYSTQRNQPIQLSQQASIPLSQPNNNLIPIQTPQKVPKTPKSKRKMIQMSQPSNTINNFDPNFYQQTPQNLQTPQKINPQNNANEENFSIVTKQQLNAPSGYIEIKNDHPRKEVKNDKSKLLKKETDIYNDIKKLYNSLHDSEFNSKSDSNSVQQGIIEYNPKKMEFQKEVEANLLKIIDYYSSEFKNQILLSNDENLECIKTPSTKTTSKTEYSCINISNESNKTQRETFVKQNIEVTTFVKLFEVRQFQFSENLLSFLICELHEDYCYSSKIKNVEVSTIVSFCLGLYKYNYINGSQVFKINIDDVNDKNDDFLFGHPAYVYYDNIKQKHILSFFGIEIEIDFFLPVKSIYFYRTELNENKLFVYGDIRVKEFTIFGLDEYIKNIYQGNLHPCDWNSESDPDGDIKRNTINIKNTNTFYFEGSQLKTGVICVWNEELVLAGDLSICFWQIKEGSKGKTTVSQSEMSKQEIIEIDDFKRITAVEVIHKTELNSYLAVASDMHPVILLLNKQHQIVSRLISHTSGITSLKNFGFNLFSSSFDQTVRLWNIFKSYPELYFSLEKMDITAIEIGVFCKEPFLFTGCRNHKILCWSVLRKRLLFEIKLSEVVVPKKISFVSGKNKERGDFCKLIVVSEYEILQKNDAKTLNIQYFEFV